ncbi:MAG: T9SS type A sorting domain-containing protein [Saprospiraceae bacterium]|nr:T9SS type A sorting domain-containing protein [Saprospiraceae bacterium]
MKKYYVIYLLPMILASAGSLFAQTTAWFGLINSDWNNPSNWSAGVPTVTKDAFILSSSNNPVISASGAAAKSVFISSGTLTITASGTLAINGGTTRGLYIDLGTTMNNSGVLNVGNLFAIGGGSGIYNQGVFNNNASGQISINRAVTGLDNRATFNNSGTISIGQIAGVTGNGLFNQAAFNNFTGGQIHIDNPSLNAILNSDGTFTNQANITIGNAAIIGSTGGIENRATFNNTAGEIKIDNAFTFGLKNLNATFTNQATITIGSALSTGVTGLENDGGTFHNTGGSITINRNNTNGMKNFNSGTINNTGSIVLGNIASPGQLGIDNAGAFFNNNSGGQIRIDRTSSSGISNSPGASFNNNATIIIGATAAVGLNGIYNAAPFNNNAGGQVTIDRTSGAGLSLANNSSFFNRAGLTIGEITPITTLIGVGSGSGFSNLTGGIIKGTGTILALNFSNAGGTLSPGYSPGKMTFSTDVDFANSTLKMEVNGTGTPGIHFDQVVVPGFAILTATTKLNLVFNYQAVNGASFNILSANGVTGAGISAGNITISNTGAGNVTAVTLSNPGGNTLRVTVSAVALPVEMVRFNGKQIEQNVLLDWETASEKNNSGFFIERSADGRNWNEIGFVGGNGTSNIPHTYTFIDQTPLFGPNFYRLRQTDFDGKIEFSDIVIVKLSGSTSGFSVFPNPASDGYLTVNFTGETTESDLFVRMFNTKGQVVQTDLLYGESGRIDVHNLTPGIYLLEMSSQGRHFWEKVVLAPH